MSLQIRGIYPASSGTHCKRETVALVCPRPYKYYRSIVTSQINLLSSRIRRMRPVSFLA